MRPQEKAVINAIERGFDLGVGFLTSAETIRAVQLATALLGGPIASSDSFNLHSLENLKKRDLFAPHPQDPVLRNHLYCAIDVIRLSATQHLFDDGLLLEISSQIADRVVGILAGKGLELVKQIPTPWPMFVNIERPAPNQTLHRIFSPKTFQEPGDVLKHMRNTGAASVIVVDWARIAQVAIDISLTIWKEKAEKLKSKLETKGKK